MRMNEISFSDALPVDGYGPGFFRIGGIAHEGAVAVLPSGVVAWGTPFGQLPVEERLASELKQ